MLQLFSKEEIRQLVKNNIDMTFYLLPCHACSTARRQVNESMKGCSTCMPTQHVCYKDYRCCCVPAPLCSCIIMPLIFH
jgi:hypothetical protein